MNLLSSPVVKSVQKSAGVVVSVADASMKKAWLFCAVLAITASSNATELTFSTTTMHFDKLESLCQKKVAEKAIRLGVELEFVELSFGRAVIWANDAKIDGLVARADSIEEAYPNLIKFGGECSSSVLDLITIKSNQFEFIDWSSVPAGYSLGYLRGAEIFSKEIASKNEKMNLVEVGTRNQLVDMFLSERFEMLLTPSSSVQGIKRQSKKTISVVKRRAIEIQFYPYIHKKHSNLLGAETDVNE